MMPYTATYIKWNRSTNKVVDHNYRKQFHEVTDALSFQYKHGDKEYDYMCTNVYETDTGKKVKIWEHTTPSDPNVSV